MVYPSRSRLDEWFLPRRHQGPRQRAAPFFVEVHDDLTKSCHTPYSACLRTSTSSAFTTVDGESMASLVVLESHLWLNLTELKEVDKTLFLDSLVTPTGLFEPAVNGFAEHLTAAQKSYQAM